MSQDRDVELNFLNGKEGSLSLTQGSVFSTRVGVTTSSSDERDPESGTGAGLAAATDNAVRARAHADRHRRRRTTRVAKAVVQWVDSFRRAPGMMPPPNGVPLAYDVTGSSSRDGHGAPAGCGDRASLGNSSGGSTGDRSRPSFDLYAANAGTANSGLARELKARHLQMIAIGGSVGTGLFVASGQALATGGPASLLIAYMIIGLTLFCTIQALGELAVTFPVAGSFSAFSTRFLDPSWGFAMGWNYALQWLVVMPLEIISASITVGYWNNDLNRAIFVTIFLVTIVIINLVGVKGYGEAEFVFAIVKVIAVISFILLGIVINIGGTPTSGYIGGRYWSHPGAFRHGVKGLSSVLVTAAFALAGTELVGLAAAETANPRRSLPMAIKQVFWSIVLFYMAALTLVGLLVPYNDPRLLGGMGVVGMSASPFVIAVQSAGIDVLPSVFNAAILVAVMSVGNNAIFGSSRTLAALAAQGHAPGLLGYIDRRGRPVIAILVASATGLFAFLTEAADQSHVFDWLLAISGLCTIFTWSSICVAHVRFRAAWAARGRGLDELAFRAQFGALGSWLALAINLVVLAAQFWTAAWPISSPEGPAVPDTAAGPGTGTGMTGTDFAQHFLLQYLSVPFILACWVGHKLWFRTRYVPLAAIDVDTGRRDFNMPVLRACEVDERRAWPAWKRWYWVMC